MKVLVAAPFAINTPHYETSLELMQRHLDAGDEVVMLQCNAALFSCDANPHHAFAACAQCMYRRHAGLRLLSRPVRTAPVFSLTGEDRRALSALQLEFADIEDLKCYCPEGFDLGYAVLSSLISMLRSAEPDLHALRNRRLLRRLMIATYAVFRSVRNYLAAEKPDRVYVYNGRYASSRAVLRAGQQAGVDVYVHEVGSTIHHYALYLNHMPHELRPAERAAREAWAAADPAERVRVAEDYYRDLSRGVVQTWFAYTKEQQAGLLPPGWDATKLNIAIYNSSEDEFAAISDEWRSPLYASQIDGLRRIIDSVAGDARVHLYLRVHPNLRHVSDAFTARLAQLRGPNFTLIPADSPVSSYALLWNVGKVVTFGSSMGIEATFWGKPSILAGVSLYRNLGATYNPGSHEELVRLLYADLQPAPKEGALIYGYHRRTFGIPFKYFRAESVFEGQFKSVRLRPSRLLRGAAAGAQALGFGPLSIVRCARSLGIDARVLR
jgi:hypothetical protein